MHATSKPIFNNSVDLNTKMCTFLKKKILGYI